MKLKSDDKKTNQYLFHSEEISVVESTDAYKLVEFKRGLDFGLALVIDGKVKELQCRGRYEWDKMKKANPDTWISDMKEYFIFFM
jgi:hypothetical protein